MGMKTPWNQFFSAAALALIGLSVHGASSVPADWKTDCVGRMQISLPGEADIAAMLPKDFIKKLQEKGDSPFRFIDGQDASWSHVALMRITHPISDSEMRIINTEVNVLRNKIVKRVREDGDGVQLSRASTGTLEGKAWRGEKFYSAYLQAGSVAISWNSAVQLAKDLPLIASNFQTLVSGLRLRPTFDVPQDPGVCLPYLFVKDDGKDSRHIGMTYRLKAHPDITVWLEDSSAATIGPHTKPAMFTAEGKAAYFWERRYANRRSFQSLWPFHYAFKDTTMAGQEGVKTFVELTRDDEEQTKDYGYLVSVRGDPDAKTDTPDLMLYVIQDSVNATKRGIKPLDKDAFLEMAETIAASVRRRETSQ